MPIIQKYVTDILTVSDKLIIEAMRLIWERMKIIVEPSGAVPLAALIEHRDQFQKMRVGIILSGGNVDLGRLLFPALNDFLASSAPSGSPAKTLVWGEM